MIAPEYAQAAIVRGVFIAAALVAALPAVAWVEEGVEARVRGHRRRRRPGPLGLLAPVADIAAHLTKAARGPGAPPGDRWLGLWVALVSFLPLALLFGATAAASGAAIAPDLAGGELPMGLLALLVLGAFVAHGSALDGAGSGSRPGALGATRALAVQSGALVAWSLCLVALAASSGSARLSEIGSGQAHLSAWNLWWQPLGFAVFALSAMALSMRGPFAGGGAADGAARVSGVANTGPSGPRRVLIAGGRRAFTLAVALAAVHLYLGGSSIPGVVAPSPTVALAALGGKCLVAVVLLTLVSASLPRLTARRAAQVTWRLMIPAAALNLLATGLFAALLVRP